MFSNLSLLIQAPVINVQLLLDGLCIGATFALSAYGLALVWGVMNVKNLCQGDMVILGGFLAVTLAKFDIHPILGLPVAIAVLFVYGWVVYRLIICRVIERDLFTSLLATFGLAIVMAQSMNLIFGPEVVTADSGFESWQAFGGLVTIAQVKLISLGLAAALATLVIVFMKRSRMGQAIRATAQDARAARVMGINTDRVYQFTYALNAAICGAAGVLISMIWTIQPFFGITHSIRSFVIVTAAGFGNLPGVVVVLVVRQIQQARHRRAVA
jgi:branched-chain amino acid transport system permease protein